MDMLIHWYIVTVGDIDGEGSGEAALRLCC